MSIFSASLEYHVIFDIHTLNKAKNNKTIKKPKSKFKGLRFSAILDNRNAFTVEMDIVSQGKQEEVFSFITAGADQVNATAMWVMNVKHNLMHWMLSNRRLK